MTSEPPSAASSSGFPLNSSGALQTEPFQDASVRSRAGVATERINVQASSLRPRHERRDRSSEHLKQAEQHATEQLATCEVIRRLEDEELTSPWPPQRRGHPNSLLSIAAATYTTQYDDSATRTPERLANCSLVSPSEIVSTLPFCTTTGPSLHGKCTNTVSARPSPLTA